MQPLHGASILWFQGPERDGARADKMKLKQNKKKKKKIIIPNRYDIKWVLKHIIHYIHIKYA